MIWTIHSLIKNNSIDKEIEGKFGYIYILFLYKTSSYNCNSDILLLLAVLIFHII